MEVVVVREELEEICNERVGSRSNIIKNSKRDESVQHNCRYLEIAYNCNRVVQIAI